MMNGSPFYATITSKLQLTIPIAVAHRLGLKPGDKVLLSVSEEAPETVVLTPIKRVIENLAGSLATKRSLRR
jgi:AbrB family looped-hinge helix DNA binding protein